MLAIIMIIISTLLGRASGGWDPFGWPAPGGRFWMRAWAASVGAGVALFLPVPWWLGIVVAPLAYWSRARQSQSLKECWTVKGVSKMALIGVLQIAAVVAPVAAWTLDPWPLLWCAAGLLRGMAYYVTRWWPEQWVGPDRSLVDYPTAAAELAWYASLAAVIALPPSWRA